MYGEVCPLQAFAAPCGDPLVGPLAPGFYLGDDPVVVSKVTSTSFTFTALPGHFDPAGSTITFNTWEDRGELCLSQTGYATTASGLTDLLAPILAYGVWAQEATNLSNALAPKSGGSWLFGILE